MRLLIYVIKSISLSIKLQIVFKLEIKKNIILFMNLVARTALYTKSSLHHTVDIKEFNYYVNNTIQDSNTKTHQVPTKQSI